MLILIILGIIAIIGLFVIHDANSGTLQDIAGIVTGLAIGVLTISAISLLYHRGKGVVLSDMPPSLSEGKTYTVTAVANGFAIITDGEKERLWNGYAYQKIQC